MRLSFLLPIALAATLSWGASLAAQDLPADATGARARLDGSPRHGEWIKYPAGDGDTVSAWMVYPERRDPAPVVVVIHEINGLTDWVRGVADQLAKEGFMAIAPDLLSGKGPRGGGSETFDRQGAVRAVSELKGDEIVRRLNAAVRFTTHLAAARPVYAALGFCWGGSTAFMYATRQPNLGAAVVYYGTSPGTGYADISAAVLGLYGGDDARVNGTIPLAREEMARRGKRYQVEIYDGAGHGFLRAQTDRNGANLAATRQAWPRTVAFLRDGLEGR